MIKIKLANIMKEHNITISELSEYTGLARSTITPLVNSPEEVKGIKTETLNVLCDYFGVAIQDLVEFVPENKKYVLTKLIQNSINEDLYYLIMKKNIGNADRYVILSIFIENIVFDETTPDGYYNILISVRDNTDNELPDVIFNYINNEKEILPASVYLKDLTRQTLEVKQQTSLIVTKYILENGVFNNYPQPLQFYVYWNDFEIYDITKKHVITVNGNTLSIQGSDNFLD
ncbi:helix-turn-helix domain-containing protein [Vagococcus fluvialis]|uniref:helix-turn-helix domain-containing protein n=1 Tax=Vagococcus fluvialis TaxID=2738 RepID=UPI003B5A4430